MGFQLNRRALLRGLGLGPAVTLSTPLVSSPRPARAPLRLLFTRVNGERYYDAEERFDRLSVGDPVVLRREPGNAYDRRAIEVFDEADYKLGYVARGDNSAVARMMDAGERFEARIGRLTPPLDIRLEVDWLPG